MFRVGTNVLRGRQAGRQAGRLADRQTGRQTGRQADRHGQTDMDRHVDNAVTCLPRTSLARIASLLTPHT